MVILQINAVNRKGSTGRTCKEMSEYINSQTDNTCLTAFAQGIPGELDFQIGDKFEWKAHAFFSRLTGKQAYFSRGGTRSLLGYIEEKKPDVVHLRNLHGNYINLKMLLRFLKKNRIATVVTLHDCWFFTGKCTHYTVAGCSGWRKECGGCPKLKDDNASWLFDRTRKCLKDKKELFASLDRLAVVGVSKWITGEAEKSLLSCADTVTTIYNWIDLDVFRYTDDRSDVAVPDDGKKLVLGVASSWSDKKGLGDFIRLADLLGDGYRIVLIGKMPEGTAVPENVVCIESTGLERVLAEYYSAADVFVTLSPEESFGKVSAEALACGTPVVCFDSTANAELAPEGCGYVLPAGDLEGLAEAVKKAADTGREAYSERCRAFAEQEFDKVKQIEKYLKLYEDLISPERRSD